MRPAMLALMVVMLTACSLFPPSGRRYVVFFQGSSAEIDDKAEGVILGAADWARAHPDMPIAVLSYTDPYGSAQTNADFARLRSQAVVNKLISDGAGSKGIERREIGPVGFQLQSQESRRVEIIVGRP